MAVLSSLVQLFTSRRLKELDRVRRFPVEIQDETFKYLIESAKDTEWGKMYDYASVLKSGIQKYKDNVPVSDYDGMKPFIERMIKGERNILWGTDIKWFAKSSGTTSDKSKYIPISEESLNNCHFKGGKDVLTVYHSSFPCIDVLKGKSLVIGGSQQVNVLNDQVFCGDLSAVLMSNMPFWAGLLRTPDLSIALMSEWEEKLKRMAEATITENVTSIAGVPSWTLVLIKKIFEMTGKTNLMDVWPNLEVFIHGGVSFVPYREQYKKVIQSDRMNYLETYNASEGFFSFQDDPKTDDMLLMMDYGIFYEFIPMEYVGQSHPKTLTLDEVEIGKNYAIVISTNGGLWRYVIGDTVVFTSKYPFKIKISGRTKHFINAFGEEVIIDNAEKALKTACEQTGAEIREFTAAPIYMGENQKGGHQWLIEFAKPPDNLQHFAEVLDTTLKSVNSDYEAKRYKNLSLDFPLVQAAHEGVFYQWLKERGKLGGQHKVPRLANHREYIEMLIEINNRNNNVV